MKKLVSGLFVLMLLASPALAKIEVQGHPLIKPYPGSKVWASKVVEYDEVALPTGKVFFDRKAKTDTPKSSVKAKGKVTAIDYRTPRERSVLEVLENYEQALKNSGFEILFSCKEKECGYGKVTCRVVARRAKSEAWRRAVSCVQI